MPTVNRKKYNKLIAELKQAVDQEQLASEYLQLFQQKIEIAGDIDKSIVITGNNNVVNLVTPEHDISQRNEADELKLLSEAVIEYEKNLLTAREKNNPSLYPGLSAYQIEDSKQFFGREKVMEDLKKMLIEKQVIWLHGRSGMGKTSLLQAGLIPMLVGEGSLPLLVRPFDEFPTTALKKEVLRQRWSAELTFINDSFAQFVKRLLECVKGRQLYIFFDQFEEFFIKLSEDQRKAFAREFSEWMSLQNRAVHVIFSLRSEFFGDTFILRERLRDGVDREYPLTPLKPEEARRVLIGPMESAGISFQDYLVEKIMLHLGSDDVESPQLQLVCERLYRSLPDGSKQVTFELYETLGEVRGIVTQYLDQTIHDNAVFPMDQQKAAIYMLSTLVTPEGLRGVKRRSDWTADPRLTAMTLSWLADQKDLPLTTGTLNLKTIQQIAISDYLEKISAYTTITRKELQELLGDLKDFLSEAYLYKMQKQYVNWVIHTLQRARLIREVRNEYDDIAYELVHEYLISEINGWLGSDEQEARRLRRMLDQKHLDFDLRGFTLTQRELELIHSQLENPKLEFSEKDISLCLLSSLEFDSAQHWLAISGKKGLEWLRSAVERDFLPEKIRRGAAAQLGEANDTETYAWLVKLSQDNIEGSSEKLWLDFLAAFMNRSTDHHRLPWQIGTKVFFKQAWQIFHEATFERRRMSQVAMKIAPICAFITAYLSRTDDLALAIISTIALTGIGVGVAYLFTQTMTFLALISRRWNPVSQLLVVGGIGSGVGAILFIFLANQMVVGYSGGLIALIQAFHYRNKNKPATMGLASLAAGLIFIFVLLVSSQYESRYGYAFSAGLFSFFYLYSSGRKDQS